ncbi:MAG: ABC transporter ATP-binding protein [Lachnospiraceae bacterium]|nr:ABC transporter ATP-binding protein [Lachnospiraceae bacterium]
MDDVVIRVQNVTKLYKLYDKPSDRLKESLGLTRQKMYKEHYALHDLSFDIKKGECVGIIGTNGAGKSTILKIITGVLNPTGGEVIINGRISALLELGAGFNMEYTGVENVYLNGMMLGFSREEIDAKLDDILAFADIGEFVNQPVKTYSSGMFVRLAFAVAINIDPEILIVDEALSVGDVFFQAKCYNKFEEFKKLGKTILFVSHDLGSISKYCDRVVLLNKGTKLNEGTPKDMISIYKKLLVNQYDESNQDENNGIKTEEISNDDTGNVVEDVQAGAENDKLTIVQSDDKQWKNFYQINPNLDAYGNGAAEIIDFAVLDAEGNITSNIEKGTDFKILSKVRFHENISNPIFTYTFKDVHGTAITGTNTMYEKVNVDMAKSGEVYLASFTQNMNLQGGEYLLSISCTGYANGEFQVYNRLYDVINITVISEQNTVGYYDMFSKTKVEKVQ